MLQINNLLNPMNQAKMHPTQQANVSKVNRIKQNFEKCEKIEIWKITFIFSSARI